MQTETTYIETNGIKLHVVMAGPEDGQPVFLLQGFPKFWYGGREQIPVTSGDFKDKSRDIPVVKHLSSIAL